jgi:hypothetical protein
LTRILRGPGDAYLLGAHGPHFSDVVLNGLARTRNDAEAPELTSGAEGHRSIGREAPERTGPK